MTPRLPPACTNMTTGGDSSWDPAPGGDSGADAGAGDSWGGGDAGGGGGDAGDDGCRM